MELGDNGLEHQAHAHASCGLSGGARITPKPSLMKAQSSPQEPRQSTRTRDPRGAGSKNASHRAIKLGRAQVRRTPRATKRVMWLQSAVETLATVYKATAACRKGCNHCCFIPVKVSATEARALERAVGRVPAPVDTHRPVHIEAYESPCPFLQDGSCSVYTHRPVVCRAHLNLDVDDLLCRLVSGQAVPVPYLDTRLFALASIQIEPEERACADLRQWFSAAPCVHPTPPASNS